MNERMNDINEKMPQTPLRRFETEGLHRRHFGVSYLTRHAQALKPILIRLGGLLDTDKRLSNTSNFQSFTPFLRLRKAHYVARLNRASVSGKLLS